MNAVSWAGARMPPLISASRTATAFAEGRQVAATNRAASGTEALTRLTRMPPAPSSVTYVDPRGTASRALAPPYAWADPTRVGDPISRLMANNHSEAIYSLSDQWRGLGGALLRHFGETGEGYDQAWVHDLVAMEDVSGLSPELATQWLAQVQATQDANLANVTQGAATAAFKIQLQSGQTVELRLANNLGSQGFVGMQVSLTASGEVSAEERAAVQALAEGLDRALDGLGRSDHARLDLAGLLSADQHLITGLDLSLQTPVGGQPVERFELHLGAGKASVALQGVDGEMHLSVDAKGALGAGPAAQRAEALQGLLTRIDVAGQRGQANAALVEQMKAALAQMQTAVAGTAPSEAPSDAPEKPSAAAGLADFDAGFSGRTWRENAAGTHRQGGEVAYQLSQQTQATTQTAGGTRTTQTVSEQLSADYKATPDGHMLRVDQGNYIATQVRDRRTIATLIESLPGGTTRRLRKTDEQQDTIVSRFVNGHETSRQASPLHQVFLERLGAAVAASRR